MTLKFKPPKTVKLPSTLTLFIVTFIVSILLSVFVFVVLGIGIFYGSDIDEKWLLLSPLCILPVLLVLLGKFFNNKFGNSMIILALIIIAPLGPTGIWLMVDDPGDALGYVIGPIYCLLLFVTAYSVIKDRRINHG